MPEISINIDVELVRKYQQHVAAVPIPPVDFETYCKLGPELMEVLIEVLPHKHIMLTGGDEHTGQCARCRVEKNLAMMELHAQMLASAITIIHEATGGELGWNVFQTLIPADPEADASSN